MKNRSREGPFLKFLNFFILIAFDYLVKIKKFHRADLFLNFYLLFICKLRKKTKND